MTTSLLANAIIARLEQAGYHRVKTPFLVASVRFDFTAVLQGSEGRAFDLVLLVDTSAGEEGGSDGRRTRQRIEALSRALDVSGSRLVLTAVLAGAPLPQTEVEAIARTCRLLTVEAIELGIGGAPANEAASATLDDRLRILLPLQLDAQAEKIADAIGELRKGIPDDIDRDNAEAFLTAAVRGEGAVSHALRDVLVQALQPGMPPA